MSLVHCKENLIFLSLCVGFFGDALLQVLVSRTSLGGKSGWGLKEYFAQHGRAESLTIAAGMMAIFYAFYIYVLQFPLKWYYLAAYGVILDLLFRKSMIFPSLKGYYAHLNYFWSAFWGAIPILLVYWIWTWMYPNTDQDQSEQ